MLEPYGASAYCKVWLVLRGEPWGIQAIAAIVIASLLALPPQVFAQAPAAANPAGAPQNPNLAPQAPGLAPLPDSLILYVLEGQNEVHDIRIPATAMPVVEVRDENGQPIEGADVTFEMPPMGPGGAFAGGQRTFKAKTNSQGQAAAVFTPNMQTGRFTIKVTAMSGSRTGHANILQTNALRAGVAEPKKGIFKFAWWKVGVLAGVGAVVAILVTRGSSSSSPTLIPGTPTFGAP